MKIHANSRIPSPYKNGCAEYAQRAANAVWDFQERISGSPELSADLTKDDMTILDEAFRILGRYWQQHIR